jgi:ATP-dependent DNA ligase
MLLEKSAAELWGLAKNFDLEGVVAQEDTSIYTAGRTSSVVLWEGRRAWRF